MCGCPTGIYKSSKCQVNKAICMSYSAYENKVCSGWGEDSDYDRGHLAASSDTFDDDEAEQHCAKVDGLGPLKWQDPYDDGFGQSQWHRGDYSRCAWTASYLMTNIVPQGSLFNQLCWADIEAALKKFSSGRVDVYVAVGNSRAGMMRGQRTALEEGYDPASPDMVHVPRYMWKIACTETHSDWENKKPTECTAWLAANRNLPVPEGCRTPLQLHQLRTLLMNLGEIDDGHIPGTPPTWDDATPPLLSELAIKCSNRYNPELCNTGKNWPDTSEDDVLVARNNSTRKDIALTCDQSAECSDGCRCCDDVLIRALRSAQSS